MSTPLTVRVDPAGPISLSQAGDEVRRLAAGDSLDGGILVEVSAGDHYLTRPLEWTAGDMGAAGTAVTVAPRAGETVRILGGALLDGFEPVSDPAVLERLSPQARDHVLHLDLAALGLSDFGEPAAGGLELFYDGRPMSLARWPKEGFDRIAGLVGGDPVDVRGTKGDRSGRFQYDGERPSRWIEEADPWVHGYWFWDWSDQRHRVESIDPSSRTICVEPPYHGYGYRVGQWYYTYNLLCELDTPGEWYLDRDRGVLYFWPPGPVDGVEIAVSVADGLVSLDGVADVTFRDLTFEYARGTALTAADSTGIRVEDCTFRNLGSWAVRIDGGEACVVSRCQIHETGDGGVHLDGGTRETLTGAGHAVEDCHIHDYSRVNRMYQPAVQISGVGQRVAHNHIHDAPHMAVQFAGNDHVIEFNDVHHVCLESNDAGAVYSGRDWTWRGTVILYNRFWEITGFEGRGSVGVYLDDMLCGIHVHGNLFYRVTRATMLGGGRDCVFENNLYTAHRRSTSMPGL